MKIKFRKGTHLRKMLHFPIHDCFLIALVISLSLTSGCALSRTDRFSRDVTPSISSIYVPRSPLPKPISIHDDQSIFHQGQVLSLAQCIEVALAHNPETRESWQRARSAAARVGQAHSPYLPYVDFTAGANRSGPVSLLGRQETGDSNTFDAGFSVRYLLFDGGARSSGLKGAEAELLNANFQHNVTLQDVALKVEEAYYQLLKAQELERVAEETVRQTQYHVDVAQARHENGLVARSDVLKAKTEKANADLLLVRAHSEVRIARGSLANTMGMKPSESFKVEELSHDPHKKEMADIKRLMAEAASGRPELRAAIARVESARAKITAGRSRYWPKITLNADYGWRDQTFMPDHHDWSLGLGLTWSIFDGSEREYTIRRAESDLAVSVADYEKLLRGVELEVWTAYSQLIEAGKAIEAAKALVASAEESARVTEGEYKNGTASIIEVIDAQTARTTANVRKVQARLDWYTALAKLERAVGRILSHKKDSVMNGEKRH